MAAPLSAPGEEAIAWQELESVFAGMTQLARSPTTPNEFYRRLLAECIRTLSAIGGVVWLRTEVMQPIAQVDWPPVEHDAQFQRKQEALLAEAVEASRVVSFAPIAGVPAESRYASAQLAIGVVRAGDEPADGSPQPIGGTPAESRRSVRAVIELAISGDASPAMFRAYEQFLTAICDLASDFHAFDELRQLKGADHFRAQLLAFSRDIHRNLNLDETAYTVANEGRRLIDCDRLSLLVLRGRRCRLLASSGASRVENRSTAARRLEQLAHLALRTDQRAQITDGRTDALPPVAEALEQHVDEAHARQVIVLPVRPLDARSEQDGVARRTARQTNSRFVLVAEQFDRHITDVLGERLAEVGAASSSALYNALEISQMPLMWLLRPLGAAKQSIALHLHAAVLCAVLVAAAILALVFVPTDFVVDASGTLQPVVRRNVFAPRSGLVEEVLVSHNAPVRAGEPIVRLRDPSLELELRRVDGELETSSRQLDAIRATRTNRNVRDSSRADAYRLSAEEREVQQRIENLRRERELLQNQRAQLVVTSPIDGHVLTWDISERLLARPVERGDVLATVADLSDQWQLELTVPGDRIGYVLSAQQELKEELPVAFRLQSDESAVYSGQIVQVAQTASISEETTASPTPEVNVKVAINVSDLESLGAEALRPDTSARAQIDCGRRSVGYVWLHDVWDTLAGWFRF